MRCTPTVSLLIVLTLPPSYRCPLSTDYRPLGSCSRAAGWSAATLCIGTFETCQPALNMSGYRVTGSDRPAVKTALLTHGAGQHPGSVAGHFSLAAWSQSARL